MKFDKVKINLKLLRFDLLAKKHALDLRCVQNNTARIRSNDLIVFSTLRNESFRIVNFLQYYRSIGARHFIFVDNDSDDGFLELVKDNEDCSVWHTEASYKKSNFGMHWLNYLLKRYGSGHWCLTVDPDELLVYPNSEHRNLQELTSFLESEKKESMFCLMLDMYAKSGVSGAHCGSGDDPLDICPYFDSNGYVQRYNNHNWDTFIQGGPRRRVIFKDYPSKAPAMNKTPLIKWKKKYCYISSMHCALPKRLNVAHAKDYLLPTGCLLHFKFLSVLSVKAKEEIERKEHYDNSVEYKKYDEFIANNDSLYYEKSIRYQSSEQLIDLGLMHRGHWF